MKNLLVILLVLSACKRAPGGAAEGSASDTTPQAANAGIAVAFRLPAGGGAVAVYTLPTLESVKWNAGSVAAPHEAVGLDAVGRRLVFRDTSGTLIAYDLVASRERAIARRGSLVSLGTDGSLLAVDSTGAVTESRSWGTRPWPGSLGRGVRAAFAAPGAKLIVIRHTDHDSLAIASRESGVATSQRVPEARGRTASLDGDAVALAVDSGLIVYEERELDHPWFVRLSGRPSAAVFSPSGHRVYVSLADKSELAVVDRFGRRERSAVALPGRAQDLRMDPFGRVLLVRGENNGAETPVWVVSLAQGKVNGRLTTSWGTDLPAMSREGVMLLRERGAIVARDARTLDSLGALAAGVGDVWFAGRSAPPPATAGLRAAAGDSLRSRGRTPASRRAAPPRTENRTPTSTAAAATAPSSSYWVQVSVSRNEQWARSLAAELNTARHSAQVLAPQSPDDGWRVVTGPYRSRESADSAGRALNRPYWVVERSRAP